MYFQDVIATLQRFWGGQGCALLQPHDLMMGAGTFHPATVLRSLGERPWRCAYVQPSRRPGDARYGENPNRLGHYYQFQVLLKPSPVDAIDLYLQSLAALGVDRRANDLRFVEDDWESPTLGAWGLGWEVWLNGMEVSQYTYFQQVAGQTTRPVPVEYTYGLERLTMALQGVASVYDIEWVRGVTYGDIFHRHEVEQSKFNFEHADVEGLFEGFRRASDECKRLTALGLALPAMDAAIATSHQFNLLLARGAISVAERAGYIKRIRELACGVAEAWLAGEPAASSPPTLVSGTTDEAFVAPTRPSDLFIELHCEELPARVVAAASKALADGVVGLLEGLPHGAIRSYATPRRLAIAVSDLASERPPTERWVTGPPVERCFAADGTPTAAALGFAAGRGARVDDLQRVDTPKGQVVALRVQEGGERAWKRVADGLGAVVASLPFPKSMEWGDGGAKWGRPLRAVNVLLGGKVLPCAVLGLTAGRTTSGHREADATGFDFDGEAAWLAGLRSRFVEPDRGVREAAVRSALDAALAAEGADRAVDEGLLQEIVDLVEWPRAVVGTFDPALLDLPPRLLVETMRHHQRYVPVSIDGRLTNRFIAVANAPWGDDALMAAGFAAVLRARFDDARFFYAEDRKQRLEERSSSLERMVWIRGLGTMSDKGVRVAALAARLAATVGADPATAARAGALCKLDLVTQMVNEFPELQGHMGRLYAAHQGESQDVAVAVEEHLWPRFAGDASPSTRAGLAVALADRLDTLAGTFGIGMVPKGNDPQGLRRAALGVVVGLVRSGVRMSVPQAIEAAVDGLHASALASAGPAFDKWLAERGKDTVAKGRAALVQDIATFVAARHRSNVEGLSGDLVDAAFAVGAADPVETEARVEALRRLAVDADFDATLQTFKRVANITKGVTLPPPDPAGFTEPSERALADAIAAVEREVREAVARLDYSAALARAVALRGPVADLFDAVLVDAPDPAVRAVRVGLLAQVASLFGQLADFSKVSTRGLA